MTQAIGRLENRPSRPKRGVIASGHAARSADRGYEDLALRLLSALCRPLSIERLKPTLAQVVEPVPTTPTRLAPGPMGPIFERENPPEFQS